MDQARDFNGITMHRLVLKYDAPAYVKSASREQLVDEQLHSNLYAAKADRLYPLHTPAATWMSAAYFADSRDHLDPRNAETVQANIMKSARFYEIESEVQAIFDKQNAIKKQASESCSDDDYAYVWYSNGHPHRYYPLRNTEEVKEAAAYLRRYRDNFDLGECRTMVSKIRAKAASLQVVFNSADDDFMRQVAGEGISPVEHIVDQLNRRAILVKQSKPEEAADLFKLAETIKQASCTDRSLVDDLSDKLAFAVESIDDRTNLKKHYGVGLDRPESVFFNVTRTKMAKLASDYVFTATGNAYATSDLEEKLTFENISDYLGEEVADSVTVARCSVAMDKAAQVIASLPIEDAKLFDKLAHDVGIPRSISSTIVCRLSSLDIKQIAAL